MIIRSARRSLARSLSTTGRNQSTSARPPLKLAIVGAGPSGFYTASRILSCLPIDSPSGKDVQVHIYERLPTPYGLVRYGVAPDHPEVKNCQHKFDELSLDPRFKFFGNVLVSSQPSSSPSTPSPVTSLSPYTYPHAVTLPLSSLMPHYTTLLLTYGASLSNPLSSVAGSSSSPSPLRNVYPALAFVSWYNGHPAFRHLDPDLSQIQDVTVIGQGNVALDVVRILSKSPAELEETDMPSEVLDVLHKSNVKSVRAVGRRGPAQVAFTTKEFREMLALPGVGFGGVEKGLMEDAKGMVGGERMKKRLIGLMETGSRTEGTNEKTFELDFLKSPTRFIGEGGKVNGVEWSVNSLAIGDSAPMATPTGETVRTRTDMVVESVGYRSEPLGEGVIPFDLGRGRVSNLGGRVVDKDGNLVPGIYAAGWAARGPVGVIASTMNDAYTLSSLILQDHYESPQSPPLAYPEKGLPSEIIAAQKGNGNVVVDLDGWGKIDKAERERARVGGKAKEREKFRTVEEMLAVL